ncbi:MAG: pilus assembly FimT family protein [Rudaea sp.]
MQPKSQSGFTMIELMVTLTVAAVLMVLAVPSFSDLLQKSKLRGATDDIVNLLNTSRANAVKLERDVNVSVQGTATWCAGAVSANDPANVGDPVPAATACDCTATTVACLVGGQNALVSSADYGGVTISSVASAITYGTGGVTFDKKFGAMDLSLAPSTTTSVVTVTSSSGKYSTNIFLYPLGQTYVCVPSISPFVSGYPSC